MNRLLAQKKEYKNLMDKIKNIEFLRVIGCAAVILLHLFTKMHIGALDDIEIYNKLYGMTRNGNKAVDLFFILSGLFFCYKLNLKASMFDFIKNKVLRLWPVLIFVISLYFAASLFGAVKFDIYHHLLCFLGLNGTNLVLINGGSGVFWYVSAMLWVLAFYYYLLKNYEEKNVNLTIALIVFFSYGFIIHALKGGIYGQDKTFNNIYNIGMLRALGGIGAGYFIGLWYKNNFEAIKNFNYKIWHILALTFIEFISLYFIINNLMLHKLKFNNQIIFIIAFAAVIIAFLINKGFISRFLNKNWCVNVAKYTYSFYMTHIFIFNVFKNSIWKNHAEIIIAHPYLNLFITLALVFILGIFTYHFVEAPCARYFKNKNLKILGGG